MYDRKKREVINVAYFPFFVDIEGKNCLVIGGGKVAYRKLHTLLQYGVNVCVVSREFCEELVILAEEFSHNVELYEENFEENFEEKYLDNVFFVIAATDDKNLHARISKICKERNILINVVDEKEYCSFYFPSLIKRGDFVIGCSSGGNSPALARDVRKKVEGVLPDYIQDVNVQLGTLREQIKNRIDDEGRRKQCFERLLAECENQQGMLSKEKVEEIIQEFREGLV